MEFNRQPSKMLYQGYEDWKGWRNLFQFDTVDDLYFSGEFQNIELDGKNILELGFGRGAFLAWAQSKGAQVWGTAIIPGLVDEALSRGFRIIDADLRKSEAQLAQSFDVVVALDLFEHLTQDELRSTLRSVETMLKPSGIVVARFPNGQSPFGRIYQHGDITHKIWLSRGTWEKMIHGTNFSIVRISNSFRVSGRFGLKKFVRQATFAIRDLMEILIAGIYGHERMPFDPNLTLVLRKRT